MLSFGLICEGPSEYRVIQHLVERYLGDDAVVNPKQPEIRDGRQVGFGGWMNVINYCTPDLFDDILTFNDYIIIQIDTDACGESGYDVDVRNADGTDKTDDILYRDILRRLFSKIPEERLEYYLSRCLFAICFNEIECWLLPLYYDDSRRCSKQGCVDKLNRQLSKQGMGIPQKDKNCREAQRVYREIFKRLRKPAVIKDCSRYNYGFAQFVARLDTVKATTRRE